MLLMIGMPIAAFDLHSGSIAENAKRSLGGRYSGPVDNDQQQADRIAKLRRWIALRPTDATLRQALASLLIDQQRRIGMRYLVEKGITDRNNARRWTAARNVRKAYDESRRQDTSDGKPKSPDSVTLDHVLLPGQDEAVWREARRHALTATGLNPLDDAARVTLVELDFLQPDSRQTSNRLLRDTARLRNRSADALYYLRSLSEPGPDDETRSFIDQLIAELKRP